MTVDVVRLAGPSASIPYSLHILLTARCNLDCAGCYYRGQGEWSQEEAERLVRQAAGMGVRWLALGGGEPLLWDGLGDLVRLARDLGLRVAVTTNGTILHPGVVPDRVHVSHDPLHPTTRDQVLEAVSFYRNRGVPEVGLNVVADDLSFLLGLPFDRVDRAVFLLPKPHDPDRHGAEWLQGVLDVARRARRTCDVLVDACLSVLIGQYTGESRPCVQGRLSLSLDHQGRASVCSNVGPDTKVRAGSLAGAWERVRLHDWDPPAGCIVQAATTIRHGHGIQAESPVFPL